MAKIDKVRFCIYTAFRIITISSGIIALVKYDWNSVFAATQILAVSFLPAFIKRKSMIDFSGAFETCSVAFICAALYFGEICAFYITVGWWDILMHCVSAFITGAIGFSLANMLNKREEAALRLNPVFTSLFSFCFSLAIGTMWEILEFAMDSLFGMNMQKSGLVDTMWDIIFDTSGALVFSILGYLYLKGRACFIESFLIKRKSQGDGSL